VGRDPWPTALTVLLFPLFALWTLPQTLVGLAYAIVQRRRGHRPHLYVFGPFLFVVIRAHGPKSPAISLGVVVFTESPGFLKHELCHILTGLWLTWLYLPVYGIEYLVFGHDRSPHERLTCHFERELEWGYRHVNLAQ